MKNKLVVMSLLLSGCCTVALAQSKKDHYYSDRLQDNLFISVGVGGQACLNPDNKDYGFGKSITPQLSLSLGKWIDPVWGVRLQGVGVWSKLNQKYTVNNAGTITETFNKYKNNFVQARIDGLFNISNAFCGYNPNRLFTASLFLGPGLTFAKTYLVEAPQAVLDAEKADGAPGKPVAKDSEQKSGTKALITGAVGLIGSFNVSNHWDINVEVRGDVSPSIFGEKGAVTDGSVAALVGASYYFGKGKGFTKAHTQNEIDALNEEVNRYRQALADKEAENTKLRNQPAKVEYRTEVKEVVVGGKSAFFFTIGKANLTSKDKVNVKMVADVMKANTNQKYKVAGYCDKATGSAKLNQRLSEKRAKAIADALIAEGVSESQIEIVGCGGTDNMFGANSLNRVVIVEAD